MTGGLLLILLSAICGLTNAALTISYSGNDTLAASDSRFAYRATSFDELSLGTLAGGAVYVSVQTSGSESNSNGGSATFNANGIVGLTYSANILDLITCPPTLLMAFFNVSSQTSGFLQTTTPWSASISESVSVVGKVLYSVVEVNPSGNVVNTYLFQDLGWSYTSPQTLNAQKNLQSMSLSAGIGSSGKITITYAVSAVVGVISPGNTVITPTSIESYVEISNYPYASSSNYLNLTIFVGYVSESAAVSGTTTLTTSSNGPDQIYVNFAGTATINGITRGVTVSGMADSYSTANLPGYFGSQLATHASLTASARQVIVSFPAGASDIEYDPTIGFGAPAGSAGLSGGAIAGIVIGCVVGVALIVIIIVVVTKKGGSKKKGWF
jgi:hypothetical protein